MVTPDDVYRLVKDLEALDAQEDIALRERDFDSLKSVLDKKEGIAVLLQQGNSRTDQRFSERDQKQLRQLQTVASQLLVHQKLLHQTERKLQDQLRKLYMAESQLKTKGAALSKSSDRHALDSQA